MARCGCTKCGCSMVQNGVIIQDVTGSGGSSSFIDSERVGWRDNVVDGRGSSVAPYTISFVDSLEYRPWGFEWRATPFPVNHDWPVGADQYNQNSLVVWTLTFPEDLNLTQTGVLVGANADVNTGGVTADVELELVLNTFNSDDGLYVVAGYSAGATVNVNPSLNAVGYISPLRSFPIVSSGLTGTLNLSLRASIAVTYTSARVWGITV